MLDALSKSRKRELVGAAMALYKSGAEPNPEVLRDHYSRAELRQAARAYGWRGKKAKRQNIARGVQRVYEAVLIDEALSAAKDRVEHPVASRLRRR